MLQLVAIDLISRLAMPYARLELFPPLAICALAVLVFLLFLALRRRAIPVALLALVTIGRWGYQPVIRGKSGALFERALIQRNRDSGRIGIGSPQMGARVRAEVGRGACCTTTAGQCSIVLPPSETSFSNRVGPQITYCRREPRRRARNTSHNQKPPAARLMAAALRSPRWRKTISTRCRPAGTGMPRNATLA